MADSNINKVNLKEGAIVSIDKPLTWTSFQLLNKFRVEACRYLGIKKLKVGHAGTLDPLATGVMVLCTGNKTKNIEEIQSSEKEYIASIRLGATTPSLDMETEIDNTYEYNHITKQTLENCLNTFIGEIEQVPPIFSAVKINGRRAYDLARKGESFDIQSKKVNIYKIELVDFNLPDITIKVVCGKGTYIRSLAYDIGIQLKSGAYLTSLKRTRVAKFTLYNSLSISNINNWLTSNVQK